MRPRFSSAAPKHTTLLVLVCFLLAAGSAASAWRLFSAPAIARDAQAGEGPHIEALLLTLLPSGFDPAEVTLSAGRYALAVENRSRLRGLTFRLDREEGERLRETPADPHRRDWHQRLDLTPGAYVLTVADHPEWSCRIEVTPQ